MEFDNEIRKQFKSKFEDFKISAPEDGWEEIEKSLNFMRNAHNLKVRRMWRIAGSVAAVAILIIGSLLFLNTPLEQSDIYMSDADEVTRKINQGKSESVVQSIASNAVEQKNGLLLAESREKVIRKNTTHTSIETEVLAIDEVPESRIINIETSKRIGEDMFDEEEYDYLMEEFILVAQAQNDLFTENIAQSSNERLILSVGGKGSLTSFHQTVNTPMTLRSASISNEAQLPDDAERFLYQYNSIKDNIAEMEHNQPVSFGVTVSKTIIDGLFVETGLIYSYLYSKSKNTNTVSQNYQSQSLHYLGVPLNLNYNLFSLRDLNVYASLGGMIEKDVYGKFREEGEAQSIDDNVKSELLVNETISQRNPQLSVNAGLGLSYPLYKDFKLYGKIGGAYYFDAKNDYKTIYSDSKIVMDLSIGIRYEFK